MFKLVYGDFQGNRKIYWFYFYVVNTVISESIIKLNKLTFINLALHFYMYQCLSNDKMQVIYSKIVYVNKLLLYTRIFERKERQ